MATTTEAPVIANRYDFVYLFDCKDGNPNGDPDLANTPRFDPETFQGLVTDVCLKRKVRDYVYALKTQDGAVETGYDIFVLQGHALEERQRMPFDHLKELDGQAKGEKTSHGSVERARAWMCANFFDVRAFGAVMGTTDLRCGQVRGPVQITFARSIDRILPSEHGITRVAHTSQADQDTKGAGGAGTMGDKHTIPYGLYLAHGFINPFLARGERGTGFTEADLAVLWRALRNMFDLDRSASRGLMGCRGLHVFKHESPLGSAPAQDLFDRVSVKKKKDVEAPRDFSDYEVEVNDKDLPGGIDIIEA